MVGDYLRVVPGFQRAAKLFLLGELLAGIGHGTFMVLRNLYLKECGLGEEVIGQAMAVSALGSGLVTLPFAFVMDRWKLRPFLVVGALIEAAGLVGTALYPQPLPLMISSFCAGIGVSMMTVGAATFYARHSTPEERPYLFGIAEALDPAAIVIGAALVWSLSTMWGEGLDPQRRIILIGALVTMTAGPAFMLLRERKAEEPTVKTREFEPGPVLKLCVPAAIIGLGAGLTIPFINLYFQGRFAQGPRAFSLIQSAAQVVTFVAFLSAPILARRFGGARTIVVCQLLSIPFFFGMAYTMSLPLAIACFLGRHALMNMAEPVASNFMMEAVPDRQRTMTAGLKRISWQLTWMLGTWLGGWMIAHPVTTPIVRDGYTVTMLVTIALYVLGATMFWLFWRRSDVMRPAVRKA